MKKSPLAIVDFVYHKWFRDFMGHLLNFHPVDLSCWVSDAKLYYIDPSDQAKKNFEKSIQTKTQSLQKRMH
jgi:hypothetical protein